MLVRCLNNSMQNLRAGRLSLQYANGSLWNICLGSEELIRRVYLVFQDINWTSRPFVIESEKWDVQEDSFTAELKLIGTNDAQHFQVEVLINGTSSGEISYRFTGSSSEDFMRNRLGLCLLHPIADLAGKPCALTLSNGSHIDSHFPAEISPYQPFKNLSGISHKTATGETLKVDFIGEIFETEDHRNWSDASYKTYCTPIELPFPVNVLKGATIEQKIRISLLGEKRSAPKSPASQILLRINDIERQLPDIGLNFSQEHLSFNHQEFAQLGISHLRFNVDLTNYSEFSIEKALAITNDLNLNLDLAVTAQTANQVSDFLSSNSHLLGAVRNYLIFAKASKVTPEDFIHSARRVLGRGKFISGGTDLYFTEINRGDPIVPGVDQINFSINPQVHSFDDRTLIQNLATQEIIAENAARIAGDRKVSVGPISLRPRFNPNATKPEKDVSNTALPSSVDVRQMTWFTEAWTAISIKYLSQSQKISSASYFETLGWRGIRESDSGSEDSINFPSKPGEPFPVWQLFTSLKGFSKYIPSYSNNPESVDSLFIGDSHGRRLIVVNFSSEAQQVHFEGIDLAPLAVPPSSTTYLDI